MSNGILDLNAVAYDPTIQSNNINVPEGLSITVPIGLSGETTSIPLGIGALEGLAPDIYGNIPNFPGPSDPGPRLPTSIPELVEEVIKDQATRELGNIFQDAGITALNPKMVVDLAGGVVGDELTLPQALNLGLDSTIQSAVNTAAYSVPIFGQTKAAFNVIQQIERKIGRNLLPNEVRSVLGGVLNFPNRVTNEILKFKRNVGGRLAKELGIIGDDDSRVSDPVPTTVTGVSGPAGRVVDPGAINRSFGGRGGADRGGDVVIGGGGADASQPDFRPGGFSGNPFVGRTTGTTPGPAGMGFTPPAPRRRRRTPMGKAEGGLATIPRYLKGR